MSNKIKALAFLAKDVSVSVGFTMEMAKINWCSVCEEKNHRSHDFG